MRRTVYTAAVLLAYLCVILKASGQGYEPPATYYATATGTGATLKTQLRTIISNMTGRTYGDARFSAPITDPDPNAAGKILLIYNRASVSETWGANPLIWNREHIWPVSRLGVSDPDNGTIGVATDQFNLRPADVAINSNRGNSPFGNDAATGVHGYRGSQYYPGDADAGDVARAQFYMATRYTQFSLVDTTPTGTQMGDLSSLVSFHFRDIPDTFERRRNHAIYGLAGDNSPAITNPYAQRNRNPFVDHPEYVWSVFVDQANDSQVSIEGGTTNVAGGSALSIDFGRQIVDAPLPSQLVTLNKAGDDGTYYQVATSGDVSSSLNGRYNSFRNGAADSRSFFVALHDTSSPGAKSGAVTIDNLDITTGGGASRGANDADDVINVSMSVLSHANPSFSNAADENFLEFNFGTIAQGSQAPTFTFDIFNLAATPGFTAGLDLDFITNQPGGPFSTNLATFGGGSTLTAGDTRQFTATFDTSAIGAFSTTISLAFSDEDLPGAGSLGSLTLNLFGVVEASTAVDNADFDGDGDVDGADFLTWQSGLGTPMASATEGDANGDDMVDADDLSIWTNQFGRGSDMSVQPVPEPTAVVLAGLLATIGMGFRVRTARPRWNRAERIATMTGVWRP